MIFALVLRRRFGLLGVVLLLLGGGAPCFAVVETPGRELSVRSESHLEGRDSQKIQVLAERIYETIARLETLARQQNVDEVEITKLQREAEALRNQVGILYDHGGFKNLFHVLSRWYGRALTWPLIGGFITGGVYLGETGAWVAGCLGTVGLLADFVCAFPVLNGDRSFYENWAEGREKTLLSQTYWKTLKQKGLPVPTRNQTEWLTAVIARRLPDVFLLNSPRALKQEIQRFRSVLQRAQGLVATSARQEVLQSLRDNLPSAGVFSGRVRKKRWVATSLVRLNQVKERFKLEGALMGLTELGLDPAQESQTPFQGAALAAAENSSLQVQTDEVAEAVLQRWRAAGQSAPLLDAFFASLAPDSRVQVTGKIHLISKAQDGFLGRGMVVLNFKVTEPQSSESQAPGVAFRGAAPSEIFSFNVQAEFTTPVNDGPRILKQGRWVSHLTQALEAVLEGSHEEQWRFFHRSQDQGPRVCVDDLKSPEKPAVAADEADREPVVHGIRNAAKR